MEKTLNERLLEAFYKSQYSICKELVEQGAEKKLLLKAARNIKPMNRTMSQDWIIRDLT